MDEQIYKKVTVKFRGAVQEKRKEKNAVYLIKARF
jgi:hypothetical protein